MKRIYRFLTISGVALISAFTFHTLSYRSAFPQQKNLAETLPALFTENAWGAEVCIDNLTLSTSAERVQLAKFFYYLSAGLPTGYTFCNATSFTGLVPLVNSMTSSIGAVLGALGKTTCESIPTSGSDSAQDAGSTWTFTYTPGTKTIPSFFQSNPGTTLAKRVTIAKNSTNVLILEATCSAASTLTSGFLRANFDDGRKIEFYFQKDTATDTGNLTLATINGGSDEKQLIQFAVTGGTAFTLRQAIAKPSASEGYFIGLSGNYGGKTQLYLKARSVFTDNTDITVSPDHSECLNMATAATETGCVALGAVSSLPVGSSSLTMSIAGANGLASGTFEAL